MLARTINNSMHRCAGRKICECRCFALLCLCIHTPVVSTLSWKRNCLCWLRARVYCYLALDLYNFMVCMALSLATNVALTLRDTWCERACERHYWEHRCTVRVHPHRVFFCAGINTPLTLAKPMFSTWISDFIHGNQVRSSQNLLKRHFFLFIFEDVLKTLPWITRTVCHNRYENKRWHEFMSFFRYWQQNLTFCCHQCQAPELVMVCVCLAFMRVTKTYEPMCK